MNKTNKIINNRIIFNNQIAHLLNSIFEKYKNLVKIFRFKNIQNQKYLKELNNVVKQLQENNVVIKSPSYKITSKVKDELNFDLFDILHKYEVKNNITNSKVILYFLIKQVITLVDNPERITFFNNKSKEENFDQLYNDFSQSLEQFEDKFLMSLKYLNLTPMLKTGILALKHYGSLPNTFEYTANINYVDFTNKKINILILGIDEFSLKTYFCDREVPFLHKKIIRHDLLERTYVKVCSIWVPFDNKFLENYKLTLKESKLRIQLNGHSLNLLLKKNVSQEYCLTDILQAFNKIKEVQSKEDPKLWLIYDRLNQADDNGEYFARFMQKEHPEIRTYFVIKKNCKEWERLNTDGVRLVKYGSLKHSFLIKKASVLITSQYSKTIFGNLSKSKFPYKRIVFLQHGISMNDMSRFINSRNYGKLELIVSSTSPEYYSMIEDNNRLKYGVREIKLLGLTRFDTLKKLADQSKTKNQIILFFTWRNNINQNSTYKEFLATNYAIKITSLINSKILKKLVNEYHYDIVFVAHPMFTQFGNCIPLPKEVKLFDRNTESFQELFAKSKLLITDYSSVSFDFAYLRKPVIYYQFDYDDIFMKGLHTIQKGYFEYERDGFGPVVYDEEELLNVIRTYLRNDCIVPKMYLERLNNTFLLGTGHSCQRTYEAILDLVNQKN